MTGRGPLDGLLAGVEGVLVDAQDVLLADELGREAGWALDEALEALTAAHQALRRAGAAL